MDQVPDMNVNQWYPALDKRPAIVYQMKEYPYKKELQRFADEKGVAFTFGGKSYKPLPKPDLGTNKKGNHRESLDFSDMLSEWYLNPDYPKKSGVGLSKASSGKKAGKFFLNLGKTFGGGVAGFTAHEVGHLLASKLIGVDIDFHGTEWNYNGKYPESKKRIVYGAGLGTNILTTEIILGYDKIPKDNLFWLGWLGENVLQETFHIFGDTNDIRGLEKNGINKELVYSILGIHSILTGYRVYKNKDFQERFFLWVKYDKDNIAIGFSMKY